MFAVAKVRPILTSFVMTQILQFLDKGDFKTIYLALAAAKVLLGIRASAVLSVQLGLELADAGLHLADSLLATLEGGDLGLVQAGLGILHLE